MSIANLRYMSEPSLFDDAAERSARADLQPSTTKLTVFSRIWIQIVFELRRIGTIVEICLRIKFDWFFVPER
jgi:hypothetical protein